MGEPVQQDAFLSIPEDLIATLAMSSMSMPLTVTRALIQLGHEPFRLSTGQAWVIAGRNTYFLPNVFSYMVQLAGSRGWSTLWTGFDSVFCSVAVQRIVSHNTEQYIDQCYPDLGGPKVNYDKEEHELTDAESFRRVIRKGVRDSMIRVAAVVVSRPFTVCLVRQIAQVIGNETKYTTCAQALSLIGKQEGPGGLFAGLAPQIIGELLAIWGVHVVTYGIQRAILRTEIGDTRQANKWRANRAKSVHHVVSELVVFVVNFYGYPYNVVSTVMAVARSGLAVSFPPYSPLCNNWHEAWNFLGPNGRMRGSSLCLREHVGAVTAKIDRQLYASNSYSA